MSNRAQQTNRLRRGGIIRGIITTSTTTKRPSCFARIKLLPSIVIGVSLFCAYNFNRTVKINKDLQLKIIQHVNDNKGEGAWCAKVRQERSKLDSLVHITYPCANISPNTRSAVVVYLTQPHGKENGRNNKTDFNPKDYINSALAIGSSLSKHVTRSDTVKILLTNNYNNNNDQEHVPISQEEKIQLQKNGWIIGQTPHFINASSTISAIGLTEFKCVMVLDSDSLVVGNIDELLSCNLFYDFDDNPHNDKHYQLAATIDLYNKKWLYFNTGSILWRTSTKEMKRVYDRTKDISFMQKFDSDDEIFLNTLFPDRLDEELNLMMINEGVDGNMVYWGNIVNLGWKYNVQTHVELEHRTFWKDHEDDGWKIIHYTKRNHGNVQKKS